MSEERWWLVVDDAPGQPYARGGWGCREVAEHHATWDAGLRHPQIIAAASADEASRIYAERYQVWDQRPEPLR